MLDQILCFLVCSTITITKHETKISKNEPQQISSSDETKRRTQELGDTGKGNRTVTLNSNPAPAERNIRPDNITASSGSSSQCPYKELIYKYFGEQNGRIAVAIAMAETHCNPKARNDGDARFHPYVASTGLFQHHEGYFEGWDDPEVSTKKALDKFNTVWNGKKRGFTPWSVYTNGRYLAHL